MTDDDILLYKKLVCKIANNYNGVISQNGRISNDDLIQAGYIGLLEAQKTYKPDAGRSFTSWAFFYIKKSIRSTIGIKNDGSLPDDWNNVSFDDPIPGTENFTYQDTISDPAPTREEELSEESAQQETAAAVRAAVDRLTNEKQKTAIRKIWLDELPKKEAAAEMGISETALKSLDYKGREKLAKDYTLRKFAMPFFHVGVTKFHSTGTSEVEQTILWLESQFDNIYGKGAFAALKNPDSKPLSETRPGQIPGP